MPCPQYVSECFQNSSLFHKALKEAFEGFCNKSVAGSSMAELMATFCNNMLQKVQPAYAQPLLLPQCQTLLNLAVLHLPAWKFA